MANSLLRLPPDYVFISVDCEALRFLARADGDALQWTTASTSEGDSNVTTVARPSGLPYALGAVLIWSTSSAALVSLRGWTVPQMLLATHLIAAVVLNGWVAVRLGPRGALAGLAALEPRMVGCALLGTVVYQMGYVTGLKVAPPAEANLLNYLWPLFTALLAVPLRAERMTLTIWAALGCGFLGVAILIGGPAGGDYPNRFAGYGAALAGAFAWGLYSNLLAGLRVEPLTAQRGFLLIGAVGFAAITLLEGAPTGPSDPSTLALIAYVGCGPVGGAVLLWQAAMQRGPVQRMATASYLTPVLSTLCLGLLAGAAVTPRALVGLVLVLIAAALPSLSSLSRSPPCRLPGGGATRASGRLRLPPQKGGGEGGSA